MFDFAETTKDMTAVEILNYYRNLYYAEPQITERGIVANAINDYFKQTANKSGWISVSERLPEKSKTILCTDGIYIGTVYYSGKFGFEDYAPFDKITHWMPLPDPPDTKGGAE